jgi:hypothetical protein
LYVEKITGVHVNGKNSVSLDVCRKQYAQTLMSGIAGETSRTVATPTCPGAKYGEAVAKGHVPLLFASQFSVARGKKR